ncbi:MAG: phosphatase PAP2 family protein [Candidatus Nanohaloarchaea archaeon]
MMDFEDVGLEVLIEKGFGEIVGLGSLYMLPIYIITLEFLDEKITGRVLLVASVINSLVVHGLKIFFAVPRPSGAEEVLTYSFPSGHAATAFMVAAVLGWRYRSLRYWFISVASLVAIGRVVIGVHFIQDVVAGALIGFLIGSLVVWKMEGLVGETGFLPEN